MEKAQGNFQEDARKRLLQSYNLSENASDAEIIDAAGIEINTPTDKEFSDVMDAQVAERIKNPEIYVLKEKKLSENKEKITSETSVSLSDKNELNYILNPELLLFGVDKFKGHKKVDDHYEAEFESEASGGTYSLSRDSCVARYWKLANDYWPKIQGEQKKKIEENMLLISKAIDGLEKLRA